MNKTRILLAALGLVAASSLTTALVTARVTHGAAQGQDEADMQEIMKKWVELATPRKQHKELMKQAGEWKMVTVFKDPQGKDQRNEGTAKCTPLLGGRFLMIEQKSTYAGMPFDSVQILGYDNLAKQYCSVWLDNFATGMFTSFGQADEKGCVELKGTMKDAMTPKGRQFRTVMVPTSDAEFRVDLFDTMNGNEVKMGVATYTRKP